MDELLPTTVTIQVVNGEVVRALGMLLLVISCKDEAGVMHTTRQQAYVMPGARQLFLSLEALEELGCIRGKVFPKPTTEEFRGEVMLVQAKSVTWDRLVTEAKRCPSYQGLVSAVLSGEDVWPLEVRHLQ